MSSATALGSPEITGELALISHYAWTAEQVDPPKPRHVYRSAPMPAADAAAFMQALRAIEVQVSQQPAPTSGQSPHDPDCRVALTLESEEALKALTRWPEHSHVPPVIPDAVLQHLAAAWPELVWLPHDGGYVAEGALQARVALQHALELQGIAHKHLDLVSESEAPVAAIFIAAEDAPSVLPAAALAHTANQSPALNHRAIKTSLQAATSMVWNYQGGDFVARGFSRGRGEAFLRELADLPYAPGEAPIQASLSDKPTRPEDTTPPTLTLHAADAQRYLDLRAVARTR